MDPRLEAALRGWRLVEARRRGVPAFRIFSDRTLRALATSHPVTTQELLAVPGIGTSTVDEVRNEYLPRPARERRLRVPSRDAAARGF
jgi:DNA topoisomerase-3